MSVINLGNNSGYIYATKIDGVSIVSNYPNTPNNVRLIKALADSSDAITPFLSGYAKIQIVSVSANDNITALTINGVNQLATFAYTSIQLTSDIAANLTNAINTFTPGSGPNYTAVLFGTTVYIIAPQGTSVTSNGLTATLTHGAGLITTSPGTFEGASMDSRPYDDISGLRFFLNTSGTEGVLTGAVEITEQIVPRPDNITQTVSIASSALIIDRTDQETRVKVNCGGTANKPLSIIRPDGFANGDKIILEPLVRDGSENALLVPGGNIVFVDDPSGGVKIGGLTASDGNKLGAIILTYEDGNFYEYTAGVRESPAAVVIPVDSVFGRTGVIVATAADYDDTEITGTITPTNYTPATAYVAGHLAGIDSALGTVTNTDLSIINKTSTSLTIASSSGDNTAFPAATVSFAGSLVAADKTKLDYFTVTGAANIDNLVVAYRKNNDTAVADPTVTNDDSQSYGVGSRWINTASGEVFYCTDVTTGAAVWASSGGGAGVDSVFGRAGTVIPVSGDYTATQVTNAAAGDVAAITVQAAINELDTDKLAKAAFTQASSFLIGTGAGTSIELKNNFGATVAPTATDDSASGYAVGSEWIDTTGNRYYRCVDSTATAAVWYSVERRDVYQALTFGASVTWDTSTSRLKTVTLTGATMALTISNAVNGDTGILIVTQDATGGRAITLVGTRLVINAGAGLIDLTASAANQVDVLSWTYNGTSFLWTVGPNYT